MHRLQKFIERGAFGEGPGRAAYVLDPTKLPEPGSGLVAYMLGTGIGA